ncbi:MAG: hypothetical protein HONBIEJF_01068 [Fimbriimonadaceae bacterium]|nr:hypothetical protein [Fimbriimonadaceae bacterium]
MREDIKRVIELVQEGKISPEDAAELIDAMQSTDGTAAAGEPHAAAVDGEAGEGSEAKPKPPFADIIESIERLGKEVTSGVNWKEVTQQFKQTAQKGFEKIKEVAKDAKFVGVFGTAFEREIVMPLAIDSDKTLRIENTAGDIKVHGGASEGSIVALLTIRGPDYHAAQARADEYTLMLEEGDQVVTLKAPDISGASVDLHLHVPGSPQIEIRSESGDVEVHDIHASCRVNGRSGDVRLSKVDGPIDVQTTSGDVKLENCDAGNLTIENKSGDVVLDQVKGHIVARTASGDVRLHECSGRTLSIEAVSGDVVVDLIQPIDGVANVRTVNGDVRVGIPDGSDCRVALATLRGDVSCEVDLAERQTLQGRVQGRLGEGTGTLDVSAVNGNVWLYLRNSVSTEAAV